MNCGRGRISGVTPLPHYFPSGGRVIMRVCFEFGAESDLIRVNQTILVISGGRRRNELWARKDQRRDAAATLLSIGR
jgi:hypothetical protein